MSRQTTILTCLSFLIVLCWWQIRLLGDLREALEPFFVWFAAAFSLYGAALYYVARASQEAKSRSGLALLVIFLCAFVARSIMVGAQPVLSGDVYRYQWDGKVQLAGYDAYAYPPEAKEMESLRDANWQRIQFKHLRTVYPPLTERVFQIGSALSDDVRMQKAVFVGFELLTLLALLRVLHARGQSLLWVLAYAWHPLVILEISASGHNDALGVAMLWLGIAAWQSKRWWAAALGWALAFLSKFMSIILLPWWVMRRSQLRWLMAFMFVALLPFLLTPTLIEAMRHSLSAMTGRVESNASVYWLLITLFGQAGVMRLLCIGMWVGILLWRARADVDPIHYLVWALGSMALLSPALHPWYLVWVVPCFVFYRPALLIALTGTAVISYTVWTPYLMNGNWQLPLWARLLEYLPVLGLGLWEIGKCVLGSSSLVATKNPLLAKS